MKVFASLRWRILLWIGLLLSLVVGGFCLLAYRLQTTNSYRNADDALKVRLAVLSDALGRSPPPKTEPGGNPGGPPPLPPKFDAPEIRNLFSEAGDAPFYFYFWKRDGALLERSATAPPDVPRPAFQNVPLVRTRGGFREASLFTPPGECLLVGRSLEPVDRELRGFAYWLAIVGGGALVLGVTGGWWFSTRALRPVGDIRAAARRVAEGELSARIPIAEPGSELGHLAAALNDSFAKLEAAFAQQARFTSDAAHELRTPVALILAQAQLALGRPRSAEDYRTTIETTQRAAQRMHGLIESLLELSRLDAHAEPMKRRPCDLAEIGREQIELLQPLAAERHVTVRGDLLSAPCEADPERLAQIFTNLLGNAVKFSPPGSEVLLATRGENGNAVLRVTDRGTGIPPEHLPHVFERFYRVDASRNRATGGAGLGLSICQRIAEAHHGTLAVESESGAGCRFTLRIPTAASDSARRG